MNYLRHECSEYDNHLKRALRSDRDSGRRVISSEPVSSRRSTRRTPMYYPQRLEVIWAMVTEEATVLTDPLPQADGDATFELQVQGTSTERHVEITCVYPPEFEAARQACHGYHNHVLIPHAGDHVRITGPLVRDLVHDAEFPNLEINPAVMIVELGS